MLNKTNKATSLSGDYLLGSCLGVNEESQSLEEKAVELVSF